MNRDSRIFSGIENCWERCARKRDGRLRQLRIRFRQGNRTCKALLAAEVRAADIHDVMASHIELPACESPASNQLGPPAARATGSGPCVNEAGKA
jgi:hypothetical protein